MSVFVFGYNNICFTECNYYYYLARSITTNTNGIVQFLNKVVFNNFK